LSDFLGEHVHVDGDPRALTAQLTHPENAAAGLVALADAGISVSDFSLGRPSLDEVFFALTGYATEESVSGPSTASKESATAEA
jgi:ABC-2 type transport system ATP-binding protein